MAIEALRLTPPDSTASLKSIITSKQSIERRRGWRSKHSLCSRLSILSIASLRGFAPGAIPPELIGEPFGLMRL